MATKELRLHSIENVELKEGFTQVCVWPGTTLNEDQIDELEEYFKKEIKVRVQFLELIITKPDTDKYGDPVSETGGRHDVFFAVHDEDVTTFALPRMQMGIRWIEDVLAEGNYKSEIYDERVRDYCSWKTN